MLSFTRGILGTWKQKRKKRQQNAKPTKQPGLDRPTVAFRSAKEAKMRATFVERKVTINSAPLIRICQSWQKRPAYNKPASQILYR
jgi:hypothetical protein